MMKASKIWGGTIYLKDNLLKALPVVFLARQYGRVDDVLQRIFAANTENLEETIYSESIKLKIENDTFAELNNQGYKEITRGQYRTQEKTI